MRWLVIYGVKIKTKDIEVDFDFILFYWHHDLAKSIYQKIHPFHISLLSHFDKILLIVEGLRGGHTNTQYNKEVSDVARLN